MGYTLSKTARLQVAEIWKHVYEDSGSVAVADGLLESIANCFLLLAEHPHIGRHRDEDLRPGLRSYPVGNYTVIYRAHKEDVVILRIYHGKRDYIRFFRH